MRMLHPLISSSYFQYLLEVKVNQERHDVSKEFPKPTKPWFDTSIYIVKPGSEGYGGGTVTIVAIDPHATGTLSPGIGGTFDITYIKEPIAKIPKG